MSKDEATTAIYWGFAKRFKAQHFDCCIFHQFESDIPSSDETSISSDANLSKIFIFIVWRNVKPPLLAPMMEWADISDLKSDGIIPVPVRIWLGALTK